MTGERLFEMWAAAMSRAGIDAGTWEEVEAAEREAWSEVAADIVAGDWA